MTMSVGGPDTNVLAFWFELKPEQHIAYIALYFAPFFYVTVFGPWPPLCFI